MAGILSEYKEEYMNVKIEQAKDLLKELDRVTNRAFSIKVRKMNMLKEILIEAKEQLGIRA